MPRTPGWRRRPRGRDPPKHPVPSRMPTALQCLCSLDPTHNRRSEGYLSDELMTESQFTGRQQDLLLFLHVPHSVALFPSDLFSVFHASLVTIPGLDLFCALGIQELPRAQLRDHSRDIWPDNELPPTGALSVAGPYSARDTDPHINLPIYYTLPYQGCPARPPLRPCFPEESVAQMVKGLADVILQKKTIISIQKKKKKVGSLVLLRGPKTLSRKTMKCKLLATEWQSHAVGPGTRTECQDKDRGTRSC